MLAVGTPELKAAIVECVRAPANTKHLEMIHFISDAFAWQLTT